MHAVPYLDVQRVEQWHGQHYRVLVVGRKAVVIDLPPLFQINSSIELHFQHVTGCVWENTPGNRNCFIEENCGKKGEILRPKDGVPCMLACLWS